MNVNKLISASVITGAVALASVNQAYAGVACLNSAAACAAILDYLLESTGNDVGTLYTALKNQVNTRACPFGASETGLYTYYTHSHELDSTNVVAIAQTNVSCFVCEATTQYSQNKIDGYAGVCEPTATLGWTFASRDCGFEFNVSLARVTFDVNWCAQNKGETLGPSGTMSACSNKHSPPCLQ